MAGNDVQEGPSVADTLCDPLWTVEQPDKCPLKVLQVRVPACW
jgi:hypothetical protein